LRNIYYITASIAVVFVFASINVLYYTYSFVYVETPPHPRDEANLVVLNQQKGLFDILLDLVCHYFIEDFASMFIKEIGL
jgi:hypothetical protein